MDPYRSPALVGTTALLRRPPIVERGRLMQMAALATCMNRSLRMYAQEHDIPLARSAVMVSLNRSTPEGPTFVYRIQLHGRLSEVQKSRLLSSIENCPVRTTLSKSLRFEQATDRSEPVADQRSHRCLRGKAVDDVKSLLYSHRTVSRQDWRISRFYRFQRAQVERPLSFRTPT